MKKPFSIKRQIRPEEEIKNFLNFLYKELRTSHKEISTPNRMRAVSEKRRVICVLLSSPDYFNIGATKAGRLMNVNWNTIYHYYNLIDNFINCQKVIDELWDIWCKKAGKRTIFLDCEPEYRCETKRKNFSYKKV